jgi:hypothetical protein
MTYQGSGQKQNLQAIICSLGAVIFVTVGLIVQAGEPAIDAAIKRGAAYIQQQQLQDGCWDGQGHRLGETAIAGLALLAAGHHAASPAVAAAARSVRQLAATNRQTYEVALAVMFLDRLGTPGDSKAIKELGNLLAAGQAADGCWTYSLEGSAGNGDNSNAQFAVLACWICRRHGAAMDNTLIRADRYFRSTVNRGDGGWGYMPHVHSTPAMTCAGLVALAAEKGMATERSQAAPERKRKSPRQEDGAPRELAPDKNDPVVAAALTYLANQLRQDRIEAQGHDRAGLYFFWSLERVGMIYGLKMIQDVNWYGWGVDRVLRLQRRDGGWGGPDCVDTAFAVLFLSKVNLAEDLTAVLGGWDHGVPKVHAQPTDTFLRVEKKGEPQRQETKD